MKSAQKRIFAAFSKVEEQDDGTVKVYGVASSEAKDSDGETVLGSTMKAAVPDWLKFGNIREMHQPIAAGVATECTVDDDNVTHLGAHIVDAGSVAKVRAGVLKGFSIGGRITGRDTLDKSIITGIKLTEISLVDRPANPDAVISLVKLDKDGGELKKGLWDVSRLAELVASLSWVQENARYEAEYEGDNSPLPARLLACVKELGECLKAMVGEEVEELLASLSAGGVDEVITLGEKMNKADKGGALDPAVIAARETLEKAIASATAALAGLPAAPVVEKVNTGDVAAEVIEKAVAARTAALQTQLDEVTANLEKAITVGGELAAQHNRMTEHFAAKGAIRAVPKSADNGDAGEVTTKADAAPAAVAAPTSALDEIRKAHGAPITPRVFRRD